VWGLVGGGGGVGVVVGGWHGGVAGALGGFGWGEILGWVWVGVSLLCCVVVWGGGVLFLGGVLGFRCGGWEWVAVVFVLAWRWRGPESRKRFLSFQKRFSLHCLVSEKRNKDSFLSTDEAID